MRPAFKFENVLFVVVISISEIALGCASAPRRIGASASEIRAVEELEITEVPQASVYMQLAKEQIKLAEGMAANDEWEQAESMMERAQADADLALLLFQETAEKSETMAAVERERQLSEENEVPVEEHNQSNERNIL
jgi:hypothetical protein